MSSKAPNYGAAYRAARRLEAWVKVHLPAARRAASRLLAELAIPVAETAEGTASLAKDTIAIAILMEDPGISDREVARRAGCSRNTLNRSTRYQKAREMQQRGRMETRAARDVVH